MNQKKAYEQTIAVKLEAIPLPDMADAIWARIENQLDIDMPTDEGGGNSTPDAPSGFGWIGGSALFVFTVALVSFFIFNNNKQSISPVTNSNSTQNDSAFNKPSVPDPVTVQTPAAATSIHKTVNNPALSGADSLYQQQVVQPTADSMQQLSKTPALNLPSQDTTPPKKRTRGVSGITDQDYRIEPVNKGAP